MTKNQSSKKHRNWRGDIIELLGSMRFAVAFLVIICIASAIGTLIEQNREEIYYIDLFGVYWARVFQIFGISRIYDTNWFTIIMAFLVISTSLCVIRTTPKILKDVRTFKEYVRKTSMRAFAHKVDIESDFTEPQLKEMATAWLKNHSYSIKTKDQDGTTLLAARRGSYSRLGYLFAHLAIVVICLGGLLDSDVLNRTIIRLYGKYPIASELKFISDVPEGSIFNSKNPSYRGNISITEGGSSNHAMLQFDDGFYLQRLPFTVKLNKFIIEYYETNGMPKRFASDVTITDHLNNNKTFNKIIEVNHPYSLHGITLYQSSFHDGGSELKLSGIPLKGNTNAPFELDTFVGNISEIKFSYKGKDENYKLRVDDFRPINVENIYDPESMAASKSFEQRILDVTGAAQDKNAKNQRNVGPLVQYTLTDKSNQSIRFKNYMNPIEIDGQLVYLFGVQYPGVSGFRYIRIPADENASVNEFLSFRSAFHDPVLRARAARAYSSKVKDDRIEKGAIATLAETALKVFSENGFKGLEDYVNGVGIPEDQRVPEGIREPMKQILGEYLIFASVELRDLVRERMGLPKIDYNNLTDDLYKQHAMWFDMSVKAISDLSIYPSPIAFQIKEFKHIQASVLQATRSPGKWIVYLGCVFLIIGVYLMTYITERRIWVWLTPLADGGTQLQAAMNSKKNTLDFHENFEEFKNDFNELARKNPDV
ncbi:cytochrome c biogenesis protein ResB [Taylorella equigenitalis]|uniref:cytochrome c biogenesis protein ResB n=1 Tax=Taylorella equigenitalis TaxID=29575 RepID=UPI00237CEF20|nr:cytochrome c biogenesis protein ResB [Taylorella equigenitalis]